MLRATMRYYGISPWEAEVLYGYLSSHFDVSQEEVEPFDPGFVSVLEVGVPLEFSAAFFEWFTFRRWDKVKSIFKEIKRRRGSGNALMVRVGFAGSPRIAFVMDTADRRMFDNSVEKMDFVLELLPYHLGPGLPEGTSELAYTFDPGTARWRQGRATGERSYTFSGGSWALDPQRVEDP